MAAAAAAQQRQAALDACLRETLSPAFAQAAANANSYLELVRRSSLLADGDLASFARFLHRHRCLEVLLFWKEAELYRTLFSGRARAADRIFQQYCAKGSHWQVTLSSPEVAAQVAAEMAAAAAESNEPANGLFEPAQHEAYELMRLDLHPRFVEEMECGLSRQADPDRPSLPPASIDAVLCGTDAHASADFSQFVREGHCEEGLLFWLETSAFTLLLDGRDRQSRAKFIFDSFLAEGAPYEINMSVAVRDRIGGVIERGEADNDLFARAQRVVERELEMDLFPRFLVWAARRAGQAQAAAPSDKTGNAPGGSEAGRRASPSAAQRRAAATAGGAENRERAREAMAELLSSPEELPRLRELASETNASENIEFYEEVQTYKLLFAPRDRAQVARRLWLKYVDKGAARIITLPDDARRALQAEVMGGGEVSAGAFEWAERETLFLIADNLYAEYTRQAVQAVKDEATVAAQVAAAQLGLGCGPDGGGCVAM